MYKKNVIFYVVNNQTSVDKALDDLSIKPASCFLVWVLSLK